MTSIHTPHKFSLVSSPPTMSSPSINRDQREVDLLCYQPPHIQNQYMMSGPNHQEHKENHLTSLICSIFEHLFGSDQLQFKIEESQSQQSDCYEDMVGQISDEISRLHHIEEEFTQILQVFQNRSTKMTNEDKWKMVVLSYREKNVKAELKLQEERKARGILQETVRLFEEQKERLDHLNNMKFKKINILMAEKDQYQQEIDLLNQTLSNLQIQLDQSRQNHSLLENQLQEVNKVQAEMASELENVREQSLLIENDFVNRQLKVLGEEEEAINKQILDLKTKYEIEIVKLQNSVSNLTIEKQENLMVIEELERMLEIGQRRAEQIEAQTQTECQTLKAQYYNSLADDLDDQSDYSEENEARSFSQQLGKGNQELLSQGELQDENEFEIPLNSMSASHHLVLTDRSIKDKLDTFSEKDVPLAEMSFDQCHSYMSNTPSKYLQTMGELTTSLTEAYQKINELNQKVAQLEGEKSKVQKKLKEKEEKNHNNKEKQSIFSSFFKK